MDKETLAIYKLFQTDPSLALLELLRRQNELTVQLLSETKSGKSIELKGAKEIKGDQGEKGEPGYTPVRGKDYFTKQDIEFLKKLSTPKKGKDYFTKEEISQFIKLVTPIIGKDFFTAADIEKIKKSVKPKKGVDYFSKEDIEIIKKAVTPRKGFDYFDGKPGEKGKDGSSLELSVDIVKKIVKMIEQLQGNDRLDYRKLKNIPGVKMYEENERRLLVRGNVVSGSLTMSADLSSQCDGSTKIFTIPQNTRVIAVFGTQFPIVYSTSDYTAVGTTLTLGSSVGAPEAGQTLTVLYVE